MARLYSVTTGIGTPIALSAATAKTVIELAAGAAIQADIVQAGVSFDASVPAAGVKVELVRYATTGTGTAYTPLKYNAAAQGLASVVTAKTNDTVEPGTPTVVEVWYVPNTAGQFWQLPLGRELALVASTILGLRVTSAAAINCGANLLFEE